MSNTLNAMRRVLGIGVAWGILWLAFWAVVMAVIGILDPDSIDPGEGTMFLTIFGPMGFFSGVAFAILLLLSERRRAAAAPSWVRVAGWGILATAIVQTAYLGHGDQGLTANSLLALVFSVLGGGITLIWLVITQRWTRRRSAAQ